MSSSDSDSGQSPPSNSPSFQVAPGALINGIYRLVRQLGVGGMGEVWEARHERTKGRVALKVLLSEMGRHEEVLRRFQREVEVTSALNHPNIVRVSDADKLSDGRPYLVMEFLEGHDLTTATGRAMPLGDVIDIIEQTAMGLHVAHGQSIIHRDLKPANIFIVPLPGTSRTAVKILDFGISKAMDGLSRLTHTRSVIGTPYYMAPEQATGGKAAMDARADQFSLAAIAYELLTGCMAFEGDGMMNVIYKVVNEAPRSFASLGVTAPPGVEAAVMRGLSKSPNDRFATVMEFAAALKPGSSTAASGPAPTVLGKVPAPIARGTLILPNQATATTLGNSAGQIATALDSARVQEAAASPAAPVPRRKPIGVIVSSVVAAAGVLAFAVLRGGHANPAAGQPAAPPGVSPLSASAPAAALAPPPVAPVAAIAAPEPVQPAIVRQPPPDDLTPAARTPPREPGLIVLAQPPASQREHVTASVAATSAKTKTVAAKEPSSTVLETPAFRKPKAKQSVGGLAPVRDLPTGLVKPPSAKKPAARPGPLNEDL